MDKLIYNHAKELLRKAEVIKNKGWIPSIKKGSSSMGRTYETALGLNENYFEISDYEGLIEVKTKSIRLDKPYKYINLFGATPDKYLFTIKEIINKYGYPSKNDKNLRVFNLSFFANKTIYTRRHLFKLLVDRNRKEVVLNVYDSYTCELINHDIAWSFDMLKEKLERKLKYLLFVKVNSKFEHNRVYFHYSEYCLYKLKNFDSFLNAIESGYVRVTFKIGAHFSGDKYG